MITIAAATAAANIDSTMRTVFENSSRLAAAIANTVHRVKVIARSVAQNKNRIPYQWIPPFR